MKQIKAGNVALKQMHFLRGWYQPYILINGNCILEHLYNLVCCSKTTKKP